MAQEMNWTTVSEGDQEPETKIVFDSLGDEFTGKFLGTRMVEAQDPNDRPYQQARFEGIGENDSGTVYFTNLGHSLRTGLKDVRAGSIVRVTYTDDLDTGQASPMKTFRVEVGRLSRNT